MQGTGDFAGRDREAIQERIRFLVNHRWAGRQRQMARDLGVSQALISKLVNGQQAAGKQFLLTLAKHSGVNLEWLVDGQGPPVQWPERESLPVARAVLPGPPLSVPDMLTGERHPVAEAFTRQTRYWLQVQPSTPILRVESLRLMAGDLMLIEGDPAWARQADMVVGRPCGVRLGRGVHPGAIALGLLTNAPDGPVLNTGDRTARLTAPAGRSEPTAAPTTGDRSSQVPIRRKIKYVKDPKTGEWLHPGAERWAANAGCSAPTVPVDDAFTLDDVVGVGVYLVRPNPFQP